MPIKQQAQQVTQHNKQAKDNNMTHVISSKKTYIHPAKCIKREVPIDCVEHSF